MARREGDATLEQRAADLRRIVEQPSEKEQAAIELAAIEQQMFDRKENEARDKAKERLLGIRRAVGSVVASMDGDEKRVAEAKTALEDAVRRLNDRFIHANTLRAEADALCDRFEMPAPNLPKVTPPALRGIDTVPSVQLVAYGRTRPRVEKCEHGLRERRTYGEVKGTEGHGIITVAGLRPFPPITERQERLLAQRERERVEANRQLARVTQHVQATQRVLDAFPGHVGVNGV